MGWTCTCRWWQSIGRENEAVGAHLKERGVLAPYRCSQPMVLAQERGVPKTSNCKNQRNSGYLGEMEEH